MKPCASCGQQVANRSNFCRFCGAAVTDDASRTELLAAGAEPPPAAVIPPAERTWVERVLGGDWRSALFIAGPTVVVAYAAGLLASIYLWWTGSGSGDGFRFGHSASGFFHSAAGLTSMAFGSPLFTSSGDGNSNGGTYAAGMAPLTISLLALATFVLLLRTYLPAVGVGARLAAITRAALLTAFGLAIVSFATWTTEHLDGQRLHLTSSPGRIFGWSLLIFAVVGAIVAVRPMQWLTEQEDTNPTAARLAGQWWLPVQGAAVAMATAITLGGVAGIVIFFVEADGGRLDVAKSLPILLAYFVNIGIDVFQVAMGAALHASFSGSGGDGGSLSLFDRHGLPAGYFALLVLPPLAIAAGVAWIRRHRATVDPRLLARSCYRMALPAVLIYLALAIPSRVGFEFSGGEDSGTGHAGPQVLLGGLILLAWFVVLGFAAGRYLLQQPPAATAATPPPGRWGRRALTAGPVLAVALAVAVGAGVGGVVTADKKNHAGDFGPLSGLFLFGSFAASSGSETSSGEAQAVPVSPAAPPPTFPSNASSSGADGALRDLANAEESYYLVNGEYTTDEFSLDIAQRSDVDLTLVRADTSSFCAEATDLSSFADYTYDSTVGTVVRGQTC